MVLLDAVNLCLRYIGEMPVPSSVDIDSLDELHEARIIRNELLTTSRELQTRGWWFNREPWEFIPNSVDSKIAVPVTVLSIKGTTNNYVIRGGNLYDVEGNTFIFADKVECLVVWELSFEELPQSFAQLVAYTTARDVQSFLRGDTSADKRLQEKVSQAYLTVQKEDLSHSQYNLISGTRLVDRTTKPIGIT
jgi:hypothetical protein